MMKFVIKDKNKYTEKVERAEALLSELKKIFSWDLSGEIELEAETAEGKGAAAGEKFTKDEMICIAQHLIAQHRQATFNRKASISEACENCPIKNRCFDEELYLWLNTYSKVCREAGLRVSFLKGRYPLVPYEIGEDLIERDADRVAGEIAKKM